MSITSFIPRLPYVGAWLFALAAATLTLGHVAASQTPHFFDDDPIARDPESQDASKAQPYNIQQLYEQVNALFILPGYKPSGTRAGNLNTIDELPDSSWFTNRIGSTTLSADDLVRGPNVGAPPDPSKWVVIREKTAGVHPGFTARDAKGETWFLQFDPPYFPEGATSVVEIASKIFWAFGYNQVESYLTTFDPKRVELDPKATIRRPSGKRTPFNRDDINAILERVARKPDGTYRIVAGRLIPGKIMGNFMYGGTRPDDPNDLVPHEHRRDLRAIRVFGAWTNLTDWKAANDLDALVTVNGRSIIKHYLQDVGSTFGLNNDLHEWDLGYEHFYQGGSTAKRFFSFGFARSPWQSIKYVEYPSTGKFEGDQFDPRAWRPQIPTPAYYELRDDDAFWAARRVVAFADDLIRAVVRTGEFSDPAAEKHLGDVLITRRQKIAETYLTSVTPIVSPRLDASNKLTFENAAVAAGVAKGTVTYHAAWATFDNATGQTRPISDTQSATLAIDAPAGLPTAVGSYIEVNISADNAAYPIWKQPIRTHFRRQADGWKLVGLVRLPDAAPAGKTAPAKPTR
ncbi:MAG: hypothetical protein ABIQ52_11105 [Vicinamibacterales bacterium]